ncbi:MAG: hypothetical protein F6J97_11730 [Leptolyngbya sp. SIO4C1]|nr:hypothetical protein [Leptolyngbya sp. SIO4C1]
MLFNGIAWVYMAGLAYCYGWLSAAMLGRVVGTQPQLSIPLRLITGLGTLAAIATALSLVMPIGLAANGLLCLGALLLVPRAAFRLALKTDFAAFQAQLTLTDLGVLLIALVLLLQSSVGPYNYDTGLYHLQAAKWIETYPAVPGLANLHTRLGFGSIWFPLAALFSFSELLPQPLHALNGFLLLLGLLFAFSSLRTAASAPSAERVAQLLAAIALINLIYDRLRYAVEVSSLSTDMPVAVLILLTVVLSAQLLAGALKPPQRPAYVAVVVYFSLLAIAIKVSAAAIALLPAYLLLRFRQRWRSIALLITGTGAIALLPLLIRNVITSGYLVYPFYQIDLFSPDWKVPLETAIASRDALGTWVKAPGLSPAELAAMGWGWLPGWWARVGSSLVFWAWPIAIAAFLLSWRVWPAAVSTIVQRWRWLYALLGLSLIVWFLSSPDIRLGYGYLAGLPLLLIAPGATQLLSGLPTQQRRWVLTAYVFSCLLFSIAKFNFFITDLEFLTRPMDYPPPAVRALPLQGMTVHVPIQGDQCWNAELPCVPSTAKTWQPRGASLVEGFRPAQGQP